MIDEPTTGMRRRAVARDERSMQLVEAVVALAAVVAAVALAFAR